MKKSIWTTGLLILASGCSTMNNTEAGAVGGGVIGAATGALVGAAATRNPFGALIGAGIGAAAGAGTGAAIGHAEDKAEQRSVQNYEKARADAIYAAQHPPVSLEEIANLTRQRLSDEIIMAHIQNSGSTYILYTEQITYLKQQGVSDRVILFMQSRPPVVMPPSRVYGPGPVVAPLPVSFGVGVGVR